MKLIILLCLLPSAAGAVEPWRPTPPDPIEMPVNCYGQSMSADACQRQQDARTKAMLDDLQYQGEVTRWLFNYLTTKEPSQ